MKGILTLVIAGFCLGTGFMASNKLWGFLGDKLKESTDPEVQRLKKLAEARLRACSAEREVQFPEWLREQQARELEAEERNANKA